MKSRFLATALLLITAFSGVGAQQSSGQPDLLYKFDEATRRQIQAIIDSARLEGLPWNALRLKAIEAAAKKWKVKEVVPKLREYYRALEQSRAALGPTASAGEVEAGASVLDAGVSADDLANFRVASPTRSPMRPLTYLADLISQQNVPRNEAIEAFTRLWKDGAADSDFESLWQLVDKDILGGLNPRQAFQTRVRAMPAKVSRPPGEE
jgi:hypothetical protein